MPGAPGSRRYEKHQPEKAGVQVVKANTRAVTFAVPLETAEDDLAACLRGAIVSYAACGLPMQEDVEEGTMDVQAAVVFDEPKFPELVHEPADPRPCGTDHLR
jgi:hypothetical protein